MVAPLPNSKIEPLATMLSNPKAESEAASPLISKAEIKRQIWKRDENKCSNCGSTYALEEDHRVPKAKGGEYTLENMRLLCRSCNQRAAIKHYGTKKMEEFLMTK